MKGNNFSIGPVKLKTNWRSFDLTMTENVTSDDLHDHNHDLCIPCHVTYQMKGNDFSIQPFNVLDQLEVIWPHHDRKRDLR